MLSVTAKAAAVRPAAKAASRSGSVRALAPVRSAAAPRRHRGAVRVCAADTTYQSEWWVGAAAAACPPPAASLKALRAAHPHPFACPTLAAFLEELRDYSMKLHTKSQAPKEGQAPEKKEQKPVCAGRRGSGPALGPPDS